MHENWQPTTRSISTCDVSAGRVTHYNVCLSTLSWRTFTSSANPNSRQKNTTNWKSKWQNKKHNISLIRNVFWLCFPNCRYDLHLGATAESCNLSENNNLSHQNTLGLIAAYRLYKHSRQRGESLQWWLVWDNEVFFTPPSMSLLFALWDASSWIHAGGSCWLATLELCHTEASLALITARRLLSLKHPADSYRLLCFMITISQKLVAYTGMKKKMAIAQTSKGHL